MLLGIGGDHANSFLCGTPFVDVEATQAKTHELAHRNATPFQVCCTHGVCTMRCPQTTSLPGSFLEVGFLKTSVKNTGRPGQGMRSVIESDRTRQHLAKTVS